MRISDWSSDVCSSDLQSQFFRRFGMREAVEIDMPDRQSHFGRGIALDKGEAGAGRFGRKAKPFQNAARQRCLARAKIAAQRHDIARAQAAGEPRAECAHRLLAGKLDHRSEEHTSELPSLMRISYAVFCLKKKKRT